MPDDAETDFVNGLLCGFDSSSREEQRHYMLTWTSDDKLRGCVALVGGLYIARVMINTLMNGLATKTLNDDIGKGGGYIPFAVHKEKTPQLFYMFIISYALLAAAGVAILFWGIDRVFFAPKWFPDL